MIKILTYNKLKLKDRGTGTSLVIQWLRLHASTAGDTGSIPGWETKILNVMLPHQKKKRFKRNNQACHLTSLKYLLLLFGHCETGEIPVGLGHQILLSSQAIDPPLKPLNKIVWSKKKKAEERNSDPIPSPKLKMMKKKKSSFYKNASSHSTSKVPHGSCANQDH